MTDISSMHTKSSPCLCSRPRPRRQPFKFSIAQSGHKTKPSNRAWPRNPPASDVKKLKPWNISSMDARITRQRYGLWLAKSSLFLSHDTLEILSLGLTSPHWKLSSTNHIRQSFSTSLTGPPERSLSFFFRKSRETSSSGVPSLLSLDAEKNFCPEFKHTCCQWFQNCNRFWNTKESWISLMRLRSFGAWSTPHFMTRLIPHAFLILVHLILTSPPPSCLSIYMSPPTFCACVWYKKQKTTKK